MAVRVYRKEKSVFFDFEQNIFKSRMQHTKKFLMRGCEEGGGGDKNTKESLCTKHLYNAYITKHL